MTLAGLLIGVVFVVVGVVVLGGVLVVSLGVGPVLRFTRGERVGPGSALLRSVVGLFGSGVVVIALING